MSTFKLIEIDKDLINVYLENKKEIDNSKINLTKLAKTKEVNRKGLSKIRDVGYYKTTMNTYLYDNDSLKQFLIILEDYTINKLNYNEIKEKYNLKRDTFISSYEKMFGYKPNAIKQVEFNRNFFDIIDSEEKAYWLGFILADGCIFRYELRIKIGGIDKNHLEKYVKHIEGEPSMIKTEIHDDTGNELVKVVLCDKNMITKLKDYNLYSKKSCNEIPYYEIKPELIRHYIRGIFDGDGFIRNDLSQIGLCGSKEVLKWCYEEILHNLNILKTSSINLQEPSKNNDLYKITFNKYRKDILDYLYKDSNIYLDRKFNLYKKLKDL